RNNKNAEGPPRKRAARVPQRDATCQYRHVRVPPPPPPLGSATANQFRESKPAIHHRSQTNLPFNKRSDTWSARHTLQ
ncbi:hypothetical protein J6590_038868, partial [Homalodisca vitripennis]